MLIQRLFNKTRRVTPKIQFGIRSFESLCEACIEDEEFLFSPDNYTVIWIHQGNGDIWIDLEQFFIESGTVYYLKPGQAFLANINEAAEGYIIVFNKEFIALNEMNFSELSNSALFNPLWSLPYIQIRKEFDEQMKNVALKMLREYKNLFDFRAEVLKGYLLVFVIYLGRQLDLNQKTGFKSRKVKLVNVFYAMLEKHFAGKRMVKDYADILSVSSGYLTNIVREVSGFTASYHIQQRIILEAKRRAIFEGDSLKEIAYGLGFCDPGHFSKYFKNSSGRSFTDFRKGTYSLC
jgi:AraC-like DNA-binding protein